MKLRRWKSLWGFRFFGLTPEYKISLHEEIFSLCYHGQGGFSWEEVYSLPIYLRRFYIQKIVKFVEERNKAQQSANSNKSSQGKPPSFGRK